MASIALNETAYGLTQAGRTLQMVYDNNGNITEKQILLNGGNGSATQATYSSIRYNADNKPISITNTQGKTSTFNYGSDGLRYKQVTPDKTTLYIGGGYEVEIDSQNHKTQTRASIGDYALRNRCLGTGCTAADSGLRFLHLDALGSIDTITDGDTPATIDNLTLLILEQRNYDVFGKARTDDNGVMDSSNTPRGFTGHEHLADSGLIHMNGRAYDPDIGRFMTVDPIISDPSTGQTLNPYSYVSNNPLKYTDPSGYTQDDAATTPTSEDSETKVKCDKECKRKARLKKRRNKNKPGRCRNNYCVSGVDANGKVVYYVIPTGTSNNSQSNNPNGSTTTSGDTENSVVNIANPNNAEITTTADRTLLGDLIGMDEVGKQILGHWLAGSGKTLVLVSEETQKYMRSNPKLTLQILEKLKEDAAKRTASGAFEIRFHGSTGESGYSTGYEMLHGSNRDVGDLLIQGFAELNDGIVNYNYVAVFSDIVDPKYYYSGDRFGDSIIKLIATPKDYVIHVAWTNSTRVRKP